MFNRDTNELFFPHLFPTNKLGNLSFHHAREVVGQVIRLADLGLQTSRFFGGRCTEMILMSDYGIYAVPDRETRTIIGFYVHKGYDLSDKGKDTLKAHLPVYAVPVYDRAFGDAPKTNEDKQRIEELKKEAMAIGLEAHVISHADADQLRDLIRAAESGVAEKPIATQMPVARETFVSEGVKQLDGDPNPKSRSRRKTEFAI